MPLIITNKLHDTSKSQTSVDTKEERSYDKSTRFFVNSPTNSPKVVSNVIDADPFKEEMYIQDQEEIDDK